MRHAGLSVSAQLVVNFCRWKRSCFAQASFHTTTSVTNPFLTVCAQCQVIAPLVLSTLQGHCIYHICFVARKHCFRFPSIYLSTISFYSRFQFYFISHNEQQSSDLHPAKLFQLSKYSVRCFLKVYKCFSLFICSHAAARQWRLLHQWFFVAPSPNFHFVWSFSLSWLIANGFCISAGNCSLFVVWLI